MRVDAHLHPPVNDLVLALWITGPRRREVQFLKWADVDVQAGEITLTEERSKTGDSRAFPFAASASLAKVIKARYLARGPESVYVFERPPRKPIRDFRGAWDKACKAAGLDWRMPCDFRRSRARHLFRLGVPEKVIMDLLGWKARQCSTATTSPRDATSRKPSNGPRSRKEGRSRHKMARARQRARVASHPELL